MVRGKETDVCPYRPAPGIGMPVNNTVLAAAGIGVGGRLSDQRAGQDEGEDYERKHVDTVENMSKALQVKEKEELCGSQPA